MGNQPSTTLSGVQDRGGRTTLAVNWRHEDFILRSQRALAEHNKARRWLDFGPYLQQSARIKELRKDMPNVLHDHDAVMEMLVGPQWVEGRFVWSPSLDHKDRYNVNDEIDLLRDHVWVARYDIAFTDVENGVLFCVWERYDGGEFFVGGRWMVEGDEVVLRASVRGPTAELSETMLDEVHNRFHEAQESFLRRVDALQYPSDSREIQFTRDE